MRACEARGWPQAGWERFGLGVGLRCSVGPGSQPMGEGDRGRDALSSILLVSAVLRRKLGWSSSFATGQLVGTPLLLRHLWPWVEPGVPAARLWTREVVTSQMPRPGLGRLEELLLTGRRSVGALRVSCQAVLVMLAVHPPCSAICRSSSTASLSCTMLPISGRSAACPWLLTLLPALHA